MEALDQTGPDQSRYQCTNEKRYEDNNDNSNTNEVARVKKRALKRTTPTHVHDRFPSAAAAKVCPPRIALRMPNPMSPIRLKMQGSITP